MATYKEISAAAVSASKVNKDTKVLVYDGKLEMVSVENLVDSVVVPSSSMAVPKEYLAYGVEFDVTVSDDESSCTRIGNRDMHRTLPVQSKMRGCLLSNDGYVIKYLDANSWTGETRDGSKGQVMVELPEHYALFETEGTKRRVWLSLTPIEGFKKIPLRYVSAYQATCDRDNGNTLSSVVNKTARYRGGNNDSAKDSDAVKSQLGKAASVINLTNFRAYARKRNSGNITGWGCMDYETQKELYWLFVVEYATLNCQLGFNAALTNEGYHQGGLGGGVQYGWDAWQTANGCYPISPCGYTDELGNGSGEKVYDFGGTNVRVNRYRGVQNPFMDVWNWVDGILVEMENGVSKAYVCSEPSKMASSVTADYKFIGNLPTADGFIKEVIFGEEGDIMPKVNTGADSSHYHADNFYAGGAASVTSKTVRGVLFGGTASNGSSGGFVGSRLWEAPSIANTYLGSRLCFLPK